MTPPLQRQEPFGGTAGDSRPNRPVNTLPSAGLLGSSRPQQGVCTRLQVPAFCLLLPCKRVQTAAHGTAPYRAAFERSGATRGKASPELTGGARMTSRDELWAAVDRRKAEHAAGLPYTAPAWNDFDAASRAAERTHLMDPDITRREDEARREFVRGLLFLAGFLAANDDAPLPPANLVRHYSDADDFDRAVAAIGGEPARFIHGGYETCERKFGPITYGVQTDGRKAQQVKRREEAIAQRERELGLSTEDMGQAA